MSYSCPVIMYLVNILYVNDLLRVGIPSSSPRSHGAVIQYCRLIQYVRVILFRSKSEHELLSSRIIKYQGYLYISVITN